MLDEESDMSLFHRRTIHSPTKEAVTDPRGKMVHALTILLADCCSVSPARRKVRKPKTTVRTSV